MAVVGLFGQGKTFDRAMRETMTASLSFEISKAEFASWAAAHSWVRVVVTSRPLGYDAAALSDFRHMAILPMDFEECKNYVGKLLEKYQ